mmetsp:Transcript_54285/g.168052  ORF Transcript_54285/g.168052 Transcript_54285/m.168052 type:complete len:216 (-) Transcript_54285:14-661(-)
MRDDWTLTGPNRSSSVPKATRTKIVDATEATPASPSTVLHFVPPVQTHAVKTSGLYFVFSSACTQLGIVEFVAQTGLAAMSAGTSLQSVGLSASFFPYLQYNSSVFKFLNFKYAGRFGLSATGYSWFSQISMLCATSSANGASANQPKKAKKNDMVAPQKARMCGFWSTEPVTLSRGNSVDLLFSSTAHLNSGIFRKAFGLSIPSNTPKFGSASP